MMKAKILALITVGLLAGPAAQAAFIGTTVTQCANSAYSGTVTTDIAQCNSGTAQPSPTSAVVGAGIEFAMTGRTFDFGDNSLTLSYVPHGSQSPDLFIFYNLQVPVTGLTLLTSNPLNATWSFIGDRIAVLVSNPNTTGSFTLGIATSRTVPEPGTLALLGLGLLGLSVSRRKA